MVISSRRFAENGKEMYRNKKGTRRACKAFGLIEYAKFEALSAISGLLRKYHFLEYPNIEYEIAF